MNAPNPAIAAAQRKATLAVLDVQLKAGSITQGRYEELVARLMEGSK